ncbi:hypothetical protein EIP91_005149 [Steccherinum ochraceum]|uniref:Uncharacterized protein n=1 Tax=Steccherinum ochraceum TaxID=92696 RepID=A0A4R0R7X6_9APHY|nr:hypothetical protein EIP91_005149 [Steccherinum ochraceum]
MPEIRDRYVPYIEGPGGDLVDRKSHAEKYKDALDSLRQTVRSICEQPAVPSYGGVTCIRCNRPHFTEEGVMEAHAAWLEVSARILDVREVFVMQIQQSQVSSFNARISPIRETLERLQQSLNRAAAQ